MTRAQRVAWWALPVLLCIWVYWYGLRSWFLQDDFAWLGLHLNVYSFRDLLYALFSPQAQGTIRPLSERGYFLVLQQLFGYDALPFRIVAFATAFADMALLASLTWRWTGSRVAGLLAAMFWIVNTSLITPMVWSSSYNELLCIFFLLASIYLLHRYAETGRTRYYAAQWLTFLIGFGALELNVVYPAVALLYAVCCARRIAWKTLPMFVVSAGYTLVHNHYAPTSHSGVYGMYWDTRIFSTFWTYVAGAVGPQRVELIGWHHPRLVGLATFATLAALLGFAAWKTRRGNMLPAVMIGWFLIILAPVLPLREHITDYYVTIPVAGLAMLGGWACAEAASSGIGWRTLAAVLASVYMLGSIPVDRTVSRWHHDRSIAARDLFYGVERAHELHPNDVILLKGITDDLFWSVVSNSPFRLLGITDIYMTPDCEANITPHPEIGTVQDFVLPPATLLLALNSNRAVVYDAGNGRLRNITTSYAQVASKIYKPELPRQVDVGQTLFSKQLGDTWYPAETGFRWMPQVATVKLAGPQNSSQRLYLRGTAPRELVENEPLHVTVSVDGQRVQTFTVDHLHTSFELSADLPPAVLNKDEVEVKIATDRTYTPPTDQRPLALAFGNISIR